MKSLSKRRGGGRKTLNVEIIEIVGLPGRDRGGKPGFVFEKGEFVRKEKRGDNGVFEDSAIDISIKHDATPPNDVAPKFRTISGLDVMVNEGAGLRVVTYTIYGNLEAKNGLNESRASGDAGATINDGVGAHEIVNSGGGVEVIGDPSCVTDPDRLDIIMLSVKDGVKLWFEEGCFGFVVSKEEKLTRLVSRFCHSPASAYSLLLV